MGDYRRPIDALFIHAHGSAGDGVAFERVRDTD
jgi:hypothetical protein